MGGKGSKTLSDQSQQCDIETETTITRVENVTIESEQIEEHECSGAGASRLTRSSSVVSRRSFRFEESSIFDSPSYNDSERLVIDHSSSAFESGILDDDSRNSFSVNDNSQRTIGQSSRTSNYVDKKNSEFTTSTPNHSFQQTELPKTKKRVQRPDPTTTCSVCKNELKYDIRELPCRKHRVCGPESGTNCCAELMTKLGTNCPGYKCAQRVPTGLNIFALKKVPSKPNPDKTTHFKLPKKRTVSSQNKTKNTKERVNNSVAGPRTTTTTNNASKTSGERKLTSSSISQNSKSQTSPTKVSSSTASPSTSFSSYLQTGYSETQTGPYVTENVRFNGRKKILVIGKLGTGKSSLCNVFAGQSHKDSLFPVSPSTASCTRSTQFRDVFFNGEKDKPVTVIDTEGFDASVSVADKDKDAKIISELVSSLQNKCDQVDLFVIAVNGTEPRLDGALLGMIRIFEGMFGKDFWDHSVLVFTRLSMDAKQRGLRFDDIQKSDAQFAYEYARDLAKKFKGAKVIKQQLIDARFARNDPSETEAFTRSMEDLWDVLCESNGLRTQPDWADRKWKNDNLPTLDQRMKQEQQKEREENAKTEKFMQRLAAQIRETSDERHREMLMEFDNFKKEARERERALAEDNRNLNRKHKEKVDQLRSNHSSELAELQRKLFDNEHKVLELKEDRHRVDTVLADLKREKTKMLQDFENIKSEKEAELEIENRRFEAIRSELKSRGGTRADLEKVDQRQKQMEDNFRVELSRQKRKLEEQESIIKSQEEENKRLKEQQYVDERREKDRRYEEALQRLKREKRMQEAEIGLGRIQNQQDFLTNKAALLQRQAQWREQFRKQDLHSSTSTTLQTETEPNSQAWKNAAQELFKVLRGANLDKAKQMRNFLNENYICSTWFVYVFNKNKDWIVTTQSGDLQVWRAEPESDDVPCSGSPVADLAIWGRSLDELRDESDECIYSDAVNNVIKQVQMAATTVPEASKYLIEDMNKLSIPWVLLCVAEDSGSVAGAFMRHSNFAFGDSGKFYIDVYI